MKTSVPPEAPKRRRLIGVKQAAELLGRTEASLRWMVHNGTAPPSALIGGRRVWDESMVLAWIDEQFE